MKRVLKGMSVLALVAMLALFVTSAQPVGAESLALLSNKVVITGGSPDGIISAWVTNGPSATDSAGQPIGTMESTTRISPSGATELFVPNGMTSNVFLWTSDKGYTFLGSVAPSATGGPVTLAAK